MAKIWPVYEGKGSSGETAWADLPVSEAISLFELRPDDFVSDLMTPPKFGDTDRDLWLLGYKHIVVEIGRSEGRRAKWKPGFYRSKVQPDEAVRKLLQQALATALGSENVVRVEYGPTTDSRGHDALKITVVIVPGATEILRKGASLAALVKLQERLSEMGEERTPIIEYATEAELAQDAGA